MPISFCIIIPARYASTRFPGKPLIDLGGKSMIQRVCEAAKEVGGAAEVIVATDDERIEQHAAAFAKVILTDKAHPSGTDRCAEAYVKSGLNCDVIVNIQGDEPFIQPSQVRDLLRLFEDASVQIATLKKELTDSVQIEDPNVVKVVCNTIGSAMYFSRSKIPYQREAGTGQKHYKHIGMYAYRASTLKEITKLAPTALEETEKLEQLRWLEHNYHIAVAETHWQSPAIDTPQDLEYALEFLQTNQL